MSFLYKVTATQQLAYDATLAVLRHHFGDRQVRWVHWTLRDYKCGEGTRPVSPIVRVWEYVFDGMIEIPHLDTTFRTDLTCVVREREDGSREIHSVQSGPFYDGAGSSLELPLGYASYYLGEKHPRGRPRDVFPRFLPTRFILPPRQTTSCRDDDL